MVVARPLSNQRLDREVPSWEFLSGWSGHLPSESPSFSDDFGLDIWIFLAMALKSQDDHDQHDGKGGENRLDIWIFLTMAIKRHDDQHDEGWREQVGCL